MHSLLVTCDRICEHMCCHTYLKFLDHPFSLCHTNMAVLLTPSFIVSQKCVPPPPLPYLFDVICECSRATNLLEGPNSQNGEWEKTNIAEQVQAINDMVERFLLVYLDIQDRSRGKRQQYTRQHLNHTVAHCLQWLTNFFTEFQWQLQCSLLCVTSFK